MVSRTPSRSVARSGSVDNVIWSSGSGGEGRTGLSPAAPGSLETKPARGERGAPRPRPALGSKKKNPEQIGKEAGRTEDGGGATPEGSAVEQPGPRRSERPEQGKANKVAVAGEVAPLVVCGAQRASLAEEHLGKELPHHSVYMGRSWESHGNPGGWGNSFEAENRTEQSSATVVLKVQGIPQKPFRKVGAIPIARTSWEEVLLSLFIGRSVSCRRNSQDNGRRAESQDPG